MVIGTMQFDQDNPDACKEYTKPLDMSHDPDQDVSPLILADRGGCTFVTKARNIQKWGGRIAVIIDNKAYESPEQIIMIDDGNGSDILISTVLINYENGTTLKDFISKSDSMIAHLGIDFSINAPDDRVEYDLYYSLGDLQGYKIMKDFDQYRVKLGKKVLFTPHITVKKDFNNRYRNYNEEDCDSKLEYCVQMVDPKINSTGRKMLQEGARQMCIYKTEKDNKNADMYWKYITQVAQICKGEFTQQCSNTLQNTIGISEKKVEDCVKSNYLQILSDEYNSYIIAGIHYTPAMVVNNVTLRGILEAPLMFNTICNGFNTTIPECKYFYESSSGAVSWGVVAVIIILFALASLFAIYYCIRKSKKEMNAQLEMQVSAAVTHYMSLKNQSKTADNANE